MITRDSHTIRKKAYAWVASAVLLLCTASSPAGADTPWDASYFPNVPLTTHEGEVVHFFDDLVKNKIVVINFIYTTCPDTCPLETAHLVRVQRLLADQIGNWLDGWKSPPRGDDYANAPKLRSVPRGEHIFRTRCSPCHTMTGQELPEALGPDLVGVTTRREHAWLVEWLRAPDQMLAKKAPIAVELYTRYNELAMPNMRLNQEEALDVLLYLTEASEAVQDEAAPAKRQHPARMCWR